MARLSERSLITAYVVLHNRLRSTAGRAVGRAWDSVGGLDDAAAERFAAIAAQLSLAAQTQAAANVDGYLAALLGVMDAVGTPAGVETALVTGSAVRSGVEPADVYHRPVVAARVAIAEGHRFRDAMRIGRDRAMSLVETDVALTQRATTQQIADQHPRIVGYRRVLSGTSCALCATASAQSYRTSDLMPIHNRCDCGVAPIIGDRDPGQTINRQLVNDLKKASGASDYARDRRLIVDEDGTVRLPDITVRRHGELGPVLTDARHDFTGASDIAA